MDHCWLVQFERDDGDFEVILYEDETDAYIVACNRVISNMQRLQANTPAYCLDDYQVYCAVEDYIKQKQYQKAIEEYDNWIDMHEEFIFVIKEPINLSSRSNAKGNCDVKCSHCGKICTMGDVECWWCQTLNPGN